MSERDDDKGMYGRGVEDLALEIWHATDAIVAALGGLTAAVQMLTAGLAARSSST